MSIHFNISPIRGLDTIFDDCGYIFCSMEISKIRGENVLSLSFMDVDENHPYAFKSEDANAIIDFVSSSVNRGIKEFYVCCDAGESRSPAIVAALTEAYGFHSENIWNNCNYRPNMHVYRVMKESLQYCSC